MKARCRDCRDVGFLLMQNNTHGLRIERCDACRRYASDEAAVKAAFKAAVRSKTRRWRRVADERIRHRWELACACPGVPRTVYVEPDCYAGGIPICEECGEDRRYLRTEVR